MENKNTLIMGIGNSLLSDEGVGIQVLGYLREHHPDLADADLLDGGTLSFTLLPYIEEAANLIVVDAAELGAAPGTVEVFQGAAMDRFAGRPRCSVHEVSLADLLDICHLTGTLPKGGLWSRYSRNTSTGVHSSASRWPLRSRGLPARWPILPGSGRHARKCLPG